MTDLPHILTGELRIANGRFLAFEILSQVGSILIGENRKKRNL